MQDLIHLVPSLLSLCQEAGQAICRHYYAPGDVEVKSKKDDSPLTRADLDSHVILRDGLKALSEDWPVLSEESSSEHKALRHAWSRFWMVDPLDGTKEFVAGNGEFTINIALIDEHRPVLGLLYLPLEHLAYVGLPGHFARRYALDNEGSWSYQSIATQPLQPDSALSVLVSRRHRDAKLRSCLDWLKTHWGEVERRNSGSALKFCRLAEGSGDFYPRFSPCCEWDVAAGQAIVEAAGGVILGLDGQPLRYNCRPSLLSPHFLTIAEPDNALWQRYLADHCK
ncbi:3'(2'),5'-bisphosphate nucleotidase CysQ [Sediminihaliea albiluteola]|uniref:3'(2'),5'-bisphosphate nucleotidase CysQ n=1 Tax=Sediminihaliea albiluteola TaxID=2758564 RepID=UPI002E2B6B9E|nr:3'(2'),5'-bisphosphate nucleotidase CysQ [Sediminihaliea albiluteola]